LEAARITSSGDEPRLAKSIQGMLYMMDTALSALVLAWITTMIATTLFAAALGLSQFWDSAVYYQALHDVMNSNV
jgi:hypothetical protein